MKRVMQLFILTLMVPPACGIGDLPMPFESQSGGSSAGVVTGFNALWSGKHPQANDWTLYAESAVSRYGDDMLAGPGDVTDFCPGYARASTQEKIDFWVQLMAAMAKYECGFDPKLRYTESSMGTDSVTGVQVVSEGLFQLSYQDEVSYKKIVPAGTCDFDPVGDRRYQLDDLRRSILDPRNNITCAVAILNDQIRRTNKIAVSSGAYWAVIRSNNAKGKLPEIKAITRALPFCK